MKRRLHSSWTLRAAAFSLPEVTISMGIVAVLMLPALAMLAGGGSMQSLAQDRVSASKIVREITASIVASEGGGRFEVPFSSLEPIEIEFPEGEAPTTGFAVFDREGRYLREVSEAEFISGIGPAGDPLHVVSFQLSWSDRQSLLELSLSVQRPAMAAEVSRSKEIFQTRLAVP